MKSKHRLQAVFFDSLPSLRPFKFGIFDPLFILLNKFYHLRHQCPRVVTKNNFWIRPIGLFNDFADDGIGFPVAFQNSDWPLVFKSDGKFMNSAHSPATDKHRVASTGKQKIAAGKAEAGINDKIHVAKRQFVNLDMLFLRLSRRKANRDAAFFLGANRRPKRETSSRASD